MKIGVIGSGFGLYGLLPAFNTIKGCHVVSICGKKTDRLITYCNSIGLSTVYSSWKEMLDNEELDAVAIAVIPSVQYEITKHALSKGLHVFAEKPLAATYEQAKELTLLAKKKKVITVVDFIFPEIEEWKKVKQLIDIKKYGELKHISVNWDFLSYDIKNKISSWKTDAKEGGGAVSFYVSHVLYYLENFGGRISKISSFVTHSKESKNGAETGLDSVIKFKNNITAQVHVSCNTRGLTRHQLIFICESGTIILESTKGVTDYFVITVKTDKKTEVIKVKKNGETVNNEDERVRIVRKMASKFVEGVKHKKQVIPSFVEGLRVQEIIQNIKENNSKL